MYEIELEIDTDNNIADIKKKIEETHGISMDNQHLIYIGNKLKNVLTINDYDIQDEDIIHLVIYSRPVKKM